MLILLTIGSELVFLRCSFVIKLTYDKEHIELFKIYGYLYWKWINIFWYAVKFICCLIFFFSNQRKILCCHHGYRTWSYAAALWTTFISKWQPFLPCWIWSAWHSLWNVSPATRTMVTASHPLAMVGAQYQWLSCPHSCPDTWSTSTTTPFSIR